MIVTYKLNVIKLVEQINYICQVENINGTCLVENMNINESQSQYRTRQVEYKRLHRNLNKYYYFINPLAAMAYQFPCAEPIYCNLMLN